MQPPLRVKPINGSLFFSTEATALRGHSSEAAAENSPPRRGGIMSIWTILFAILVVAWLSGLTVFHVAGGLIHLLLVFAVISLVLHFIMGRRTT